MSVNWKRGTPLLSVSVFCLAGWLLFHELRAYHWHDIRQSVEAIPLSSIVLCVLLATANYVILIGYDLLALRAIDKKLPLRQVAFASFTGYVASYNFGATLGGLPMRYRLYSSLGLSAVDIVRLMMILGITFWIGLFTAGGLVFVIDPFRIPSTLSLPFQSIRGLGVALLAIVSVYVLMTVLWRKPLRIRGHEMQLPSTQLTFAQMALATTDLMVAAACLFVLCPADIGLSYSQFLGVYLLALVAVIMTHVPGGVGVLELVMLTMTKSPNPQALVAAMMVFRVIYYLLPLLVATLMLGVTEYRLHRRHVDPWMGQLGQAITSVLPSFVAGLTFCAGIVLILSGATPTASDRLPLLYRLIPLSLVESSHFVGSVVGAALLLVARGLQRRLDSVWWMAVDLVGVGVVVSVLKGLDFEEAAFLSLVLVALVASRRRFYRRGSLLHERYSAGWLSAIVMAVACSFWLGLFAFKHVEYRTDLWWQFEASRDVSRFLRGSVGVVSVLLFIALGRLTKRERGPQWGPPSESDLAHVAEIVSRSPRTSANLALLGDKQFLFSDDRSAFIMYAVERRSWIVMGDPVGPPAQWSELIWKFRELCDQYDGWPVFYQVEPDSLPLYLDQGLTLLKLGEEARVPVPEFSLESSHRKSLRGDHSKLLKADCTFEIIPASEVHELLPRLREISDAWKTAKHAPEKGFSLGFFDAQYLSRSPCAVIKQGPHIVAFANMWLGANQDEFSIDLMRYDPAGPHGMMDFLFVELLLWGQQQGYRWFNFGMAPLSGIEDRPLAPLWNKAAGLIFRHGSHFYGFDGLRQYKDKFNPIWHPKYLASPGGFSLPRIVADVATLIGRHRPTEENRAGS